MIKIGFKTMGAPNIIGSLILNRAGIIVVFPSVLAYLDFEKNAKQIANPSVVPAPPIQINQWKNGSAAI